MRLSALRVAGPDELERRTADGAVLYCCPGIEPHDAATWRVLVARQDEQYVPLDMDDCNCPECGTLGQRISDIRTWRRR